MTVIGKALELAGAAACQSLWRSVIFLFSKTAAMAALKTAIDF